MSLVIHFFLFCVGRAELVVLFRDVLGDLLVGGHGACAILDGLDPQGLEGQLDLEVEVPLAAYVTGAAEGICIDDLEELRSPLQPSFGHGRADSHLAEGAVGVEVVPDVAGASRAELDARHVGVLYPVAALALDAPAHIVNEIVQLSYVELNLLLCMASYPP